LRASSRRSETSPEEAWTTTERALTGCAEEGDGSVSPRARRGGRDHGADWGALAAVPVEVEKGAAEAHLRGDRGAGDARLGGGDARDGRDNAEGGHGGGHFDVKCGGLTRSVRQAVGGSWGAIDSTANPHRPVVG